MSLDYIRDYYGVPANLMGRVRYTGAKLPRLGTIEGANGAHVLIRLDGENHANPYHPTWELEYLPRDSGSGRNGENSRSEVEGEAPQSGPKGIAHTSPGSPHKE